LAGDVSYDPLGRLNRRRHAVSFVVERKPALVPLSLISRVIDEFLRR